MLGCGGPSCKEPRIEGGDRLYTCLKETSVVEYKKDGLGEKEAVGRHLAQGRWWGKM